MCLSSPVTYCQSELPLKETTTLGLGNHGLDSRFSSGKLCGSGTLVDKLYKLDCVLSSELHNVGETAAMAVASCNIDLWHQRLGHLCEQQIKCMVEKKLASGIKLPKSCALHFCEGCVEGKMHRGAFNTVGVCSSKRLQLVHSDVCGPMPAESLGGHQVFCDLY